MEQHSGDRLFMGTLDSHLVSLDAKTGSVIWDVAVEDYQKGFSITHAPLAIDGKIIVGITAGYGPTVVSAINRPVNTVPRMPS